MSKLELRASLCSKKLFDNTEEIAHLFEGDAPSDSPTEGDIKPLGKLLDFLVETKLLVHWLVTLLMQTDF